MMRDNWKSVLIKARRTSKTRAGGRIPSNAVIVVVGDEKGKVGLGMAKGKDSKTIYTKAEKRAIKNAINVNLYQERTIVHDTVGEWCATKVIIKQAVRGNGVRSGDIPKLIFQLAGIKDIVCKCLGNPNPYNVVRAVFEALEGVESIQDMAKRRGLNMDKLLKDRALGSVKTHDRVVEEPIVRKEKPEKNSENFKDRRPKRTFNKDKPVIKTAEGSEKKVFDRAMKMRKKDVSEGQKFSEKKVDSSGEKVNQEGGNK
jgi:small subunit ribosomal protein S5